MREESTEMADKIGRDWREEDLVQFRLITYRGEENRSVRNGKRGKAVG